MVRPIELRRAIASELQEHLLPFWRERSVDTRQGGFIAEMANDGTVREDAPKGLILNTRILWSFAAAYRALGDERDLVLARRAYDYLIDHFLDRENGGFHWLVDTAGKVIEESKKIYGQAFSIYALAEYHLATGAPEALATANEVCGHIERHAHDGRHLGYIEAVAADWSPTEDLRLSEKDMVAAKSMNNHLHVLEAYTNLYRVVPSARIEMRLRELIDCFDRFVLARGPHGCHLQHFFDDRWEVCSDSYTYGHDIEASWLLYESAAILGDESLRAHVGRIATDLAHTVLHEALDERGGLAYEGRDGDIVDRHREWWCQAEAVVGFWNAYRLTAEPGYASAAARCWEFVRDHMVDRDHGEWFWRVSDDGTVDQSEPKVSVWKGPYHNIRMCLEMLQRIDHHESRSVS